MNRLAPRGAMNMPIMMADQILRPVVAVDIDGTLGEYHFHFAQYAAAFLQRSVPLHWRGESPYWKQFGVSKERYREMKLGYRQGRMKRSMPVILGAAELCRQVRRAGAELWLCTTRPYLRLDNIDPDTRFWLRHHHIRYDGFLFGESKYRDLKSLVGSERVVAVLDDEPEQIERAQRLGLPAHLINRPYNLGAEVPSLLTLPVATQFFVEQCEQWLKEKGVKK